MVLMVSRLKGRALEWFHSKTEFVAMTVDQLLQELGDISADWPSRVAVRREFDRRTWKRGKTYAENFHQKVILGNRASIDDRDMVEYRLDGVPDVMLRNNARLQRFQTKEALLGAFKGVTVDSGIQLGGRQFQRAEYGPQGGNDEFRRGGGSFWRNDGPVQRGGSGRQYDDSNARRENIDHWRRYEAVRRDYGPKMQRHGTQASVARCYNCGERDHFSFECPLRNPGRRCFECREFGHVARNCPKSNRMARESLAIC
ncbi:uncharacterized protein LOC144477441 [Augochlora pura]